MTAAVPNGDRSLPARTLAALRSRFSLQTDRAEDSEIDARIRADVTVQGTSPWVLMFAVLIASIGLNVNSTAAIIGAMLISPLMGPIMGVGYGVGVRDFALIRHAISNLAVATLIGLLVSAAYCTLSPLNSAPSICIRLTACSLPQRLHSLPAPFRRGRSNSSTHALRRGCGSPLGLW